MAIIKCPECGHSVSDKAPFCPSCGLVIAGKQTTEANTKSTNPRQTQRKDDPKDKGTNKTLIVVAVIFALIVAGVCFYFYHNAQNDKEQEAYEYAMTSQDLTVLNGFLDTYPNAPQEHRDSITAHITALQQADQEWTNVMMSGSRAALKDYLNRHPDSPYKAEAMRQIDSLDWVAADREGTIEAVEDYLTQHPDGRFYEEANEKMTTLSSTTVQPEDMQLVESLFATFLQSLNNKDEDALTSTVNPLLKTFLGKANATRSDVVTFMHKIYKNHVVRMNWTSSADYKVVKKPSTDGKTEMAVTFTALQQVEDVEGATTESKYRIMATVNADGRICELNMTRILD